MISIHAPRGGSDSSCIQPPCPCVYFNPRSPWGERPDSGGKTSAQIAISIHAPRGGSDSVFCSLLPDTPISIHAPRGGSDFDVLTDKGRIIISIHAPRGGSD